MRDVRDFEEDCYQQTYRFDFENGNAPTLQLRSYGSISKFRSFRSDVTPTTRVNGSYIYPTAYTSFFASVRAEPGLGRFYTTTNPNSPVGYKVDVVETGVIITKEWYYGCTVGLLPSIPAVVLARARSSVLGQIKANRLSLGEFFGEARESISLIGSLLRDVLRLRRKLTAGGATFGSFLSASRSASGVNLPKRLARRYLQFMYGIRPLMSDLYGIAQGLDWTSKPMATAYSRVLDSSYTVPSVTGQPYSSFSGKVERGVIVECAYECTNPDLYALWRYGLTNPLSLAWELTTLSFVVDWFTGFGAWLSALQQPVGLRALYGYETQFVENSLLYEKALVASRTEANKEILREQRPHARYNLKAMKRVLGVGFPIPPVYLSAGLSTGQVLSLIALITART